MNTNIKLPSGVTDSWFLMTCGGEVYDGRIIHGSRLFEILLDMLYGKADDADPEAAQRIAEHIGDEGCWNEYDGKFTRYLHEEEDGSIEFHMINDREAVPILDGARKAGLL